MVKIVSCRTGPGFYLFLFARVLDEILIGVIKAIGGICGHVIFLNNLRVYAGLLSRTWKFSRNALYFLVHGNFKAKKIYIMSILPCGMVASHKCFRKSLDLK